MKRFVLAERTRASDAFPNAILVPVTLHGYQMIVLPEWVALRRPICCMLIPCQPSTLSVAAVSLSFEEELPASLTELLQDPIVSTKTSDFGFILTLDNISSKSTMNVPDNDIDAAWPAVIQMISLRRCGFKNATLPLSTVIIESACSRFGLLVSDFNASFLGLCKLAQVALRLFHFLHPDFIEDGLLCAYTTEAIRKANLSLLGSSEDILTLSLVKALFSKVSSLRKKLVSLGFAWTKDPLLDDSQLRKFLRGFQKNHGIPVTMVLDQDTLDKMDMLLIKPTLPTVAAVSSTVNVIRTKMGELKSLKNDAVRSSDDDDYWDDGALSEPMSHDTPLDVNNYIKLYQRFEASRSHKKQKKMGKRLNAITQAPARMIKGIKSSTSKTIEGITSKGKNRPQHGEQVRPAVSTEGMHSSEGDAGESDEDQKGSQHLISPDDYLTSATSYSSKNVLSPPNPMVQMGKLPVNDLKKSDWDARRGSLPVTKLYGNRKTSLLVTIQGSNSAGDAQDHIPFEPLELITEKQVHDSFVELNEKMKALTLKRQALKQKSEEMNELFDTAKSQYEQEYAESKKLSEMVQRQKERQKLLAESLKIIENASSRIGYSLGTLEDKMVDIEEGSRVMFRRLKALESKLTTF